jgi:hypothetical protein
MAITTINNTFTIRTISTNLTQGDKLIFKFKINSTDTSNFTASLSQGNLNIKSNTIATGYAYASTTCIAGTPGFVSTGSSNNELVLNSSLSSFYNEGYQFVPNPDLQEVIGNDPSSLYPIYGDVDYPFSLDVYDIVVIILEDNSFIESRITSINNDGNQLRIFLGNDLNNDTKTAINTQTFKRFLLLKRIEDETNTILNFQKRPGSTSYGFLIPENLSPDILENIDTITKQVKQKLLADQQGTTS